MTLPILNFLTQRVREYDPDYEYRKGTAFSELFIQPQALMVQPLRDEANDIFTNQSLKRILDLDAPNDYPEDAVDEIVENYFVFRRTGNLSGGIARLLFREPKDINYVAGALEFTNTEGLVYTNRSNIAFTRTQMSSQLDQEFFFIDVEIEAQFEGREYDAAPNEIIESSEPDAIRVFNANPISGGADRENNTQYIQRAQRSIGERSLNTGKGANAVLFETFANQLTELQMIGMGDPEMMRDIRFNYHIGGQIDAWVKTPQIQEGFFDVNGLLLDTTRRFSTLTNVRLDGTQDTSLGVISLDNSENEVRGFSTEQFNRPATFFSYVNIENGVDLSGGQFLQIGLNQGPLENIKISGANPANTQPAEIVTRINVGTGRQIASIAVNPIIVSRRSTGYTPGDNQNILYDPTPSAFKNIVPGDNITILVGDNAGNYVVDTVPSENQITLTSNIPNEQSEINYRAGRTGTYIKIQTEEQGVDSQIALASPSVGSDALPFALGLAPSSMPYEFDGQGEIEYQEGIDFDVDLLNGDVSRIVGPTITPTRATGLVSKSIFFQDLSSDIFLNVEAGDIITISEASDESIEKDYKVLEKVTNNSLRVDAFFSVTDTNIEYRITRTGIKDGSLVKFSYDYNPLSIDIGDRVELDQFGRELGIRPGREDQTITDTALLYVTSIELIDPVSGEPIGEELEGKGGYGRGGYGRGGYGRGSRSQWFHQVDNPELRFSAKEDSYLVMDAAFLGQSFRVNYRYVPEVRSFQDFVESERERILDAETLVRHLIPAVVDMTINYTTDPNNPGTATNEEILEVVREYIDEVPAGQPLDASDIVDVIYDLIDPSRQRNVIVQQPINMKATIYNTDASLRIIESSNRLEVPEEEIPPFTRAPLSPRTTHWIAGNIVLNRTTGNNGGLAV